MAAEDQHYDELVTTQRLKAAIHYTVGRIAAEHQGAENCTFSRQMIAVVSEAVYKYSQSLARDVELFARHAKRTTVNTDDVILTTRKSPKLAAHLRDLASEQAAAAAKDDTKGAGRKDKTRKNEKAPVLTENTDNVVVATDEESNLGS